MLPGSENALATAQIANFVDSDINALLFRVYVVPPIVRPCQKLQS
jgi:hypothetical protein